MLSTRRLPAVAAFILALIPTIVFGAASPAQADTVVFDTGHVDAFHVTAPGNALELDMKEDVTGSAVRRSPESVILHVAEAAWSEETSAVPGIDRATYYLPQTQQADLIWPGWDTQSVAGAGFSTIDLNFKRVSGPGEIYIFETGGLGGINSVVADGSLHLSSGTTITQANPAHRHINWAFTEPGQYTMEVSASGTNTSGTTV
ncbi:choice-of-anchor M domain-containing protein [Corynebacterium mayonis]|uniref:choice-of-anchor M domain-containing protein n=1 Tax=Corynebacterium mayonis TaxID=3062461 RepID=UPI003140B61E